MEYEDLEAAYLSCVVGEELPTLLIRDGYMYARQKDGTVLKRKVEDVEPAES